MISFLKTVLILLLVYLGVKTLLRLAKPYLLRFLAKKVNQKFESAFGQNPFQQASDDTIQVNKTTNKNPKSKRVVGEYIDFEEVD